METIFSPESYNCLINGGWSNNRTIDRNVIAKKLTNEGYKIFPRAIEFLEKFEGLHIIFHNKRTKKNDDFDFDIEKAFHIEVPERINEDYKDRIGANLLCPIGSAYREHFILIMDENGIVYGGYDDYLVKMGDSYIEAINSIISDQEFMEIE